MIGETILHYKIIEKLGEGGMGAVYKAQDTKLDRFVALKFLPSQVSATEDEKARFVQEAKATSAMNHPNVCTIYDIQEHNGQLFIVMEFIDGITLRNNKQNLSEKRILDIGVQIAEGLAAAHEKGIVHRDIKPENIMIRKDGIVQIMDFGLAKLNAAGNVSRLTKAGTTMGTMGYMSPEQVQGLDVDHRTDIFSLGVVLYEMFAGESPFKGIHETAIMYEIVNVDPSPISLIKEGIDLELDNIILECLEKDKEERCQSAKELAKDLRKVKKSTGDRKSKVYNVDATVVKTGTGQSHISKPSGSFSVEILNHRFDLTKLFKLKYISWLIAAIFLLIIVILWFNWNAASPESFVKFQQLTEQSGQELFPDISHDGNYIIYTKSVDGFMHILLQRVGGGNAIDLTKDSQYDNYQPSFSPNGELIVFRSERDGGGIFLMGSTGESVRRLTNFGFNPVWSPDGKKVLFATESVMHPYSRQTRSQLWTMDIDAGKLEKIYNGDAVQPCWSPNGKWIAYWGLPLGTGKRVIYIIPSSGGKPEMITNDEYINWSPTWSPDNKYLYFSSNRGGSMNLWRVRIDGGSGKPVSGLEPVITPSLFCQMARFSNDGKKIIYVSSELRDNVYKVVFDPNAEKTVGLPIPVTNGTKQYLYPSISPDNKWIAASSTGQQEDIYIMHTDGSDISKLTNDVFKDRGPNWSPDGKSLTFYSDRTGKYEIWEINTDGSNLRQLTSTSGQILNPVWFPNGHLIVSTISNPKAAVLLSADSSSTQKLDYLPYLKDKGMFFIANSVSPDGKYIAGYREDQVTGAGKGIVIYSNSGKNYTTLSNSGNGAYWFSDSKRILYVDNGKFNVIDIDSRKSRVVYDPPTKVTNWWNYTFSPDNKAIYFIEEDNQSNIWMGYLK